MKKLLSTMIAMSTALAPLSVLSVNAVGTESSIEVSTVTAKAGDTVDVPVKITENAGVVAIGFTVDYDKNALELLSIKDNALFKDASLTTGGDKTAVPFRITIDNALATENYTTTGEVVVLSFQVRDTAKDGLSEIKLNMDNGSTFNVDMDNVVFQSVNGGIQIGDVETTTKAQTTSQTTVSTTKATTTQATESTTKATESTTKATTTQATESTTKATTTQATESTTKATTTQATESTTKATETTSAAAKGDIEIASVTAKAGDEIEVPVKINKNAGLVALGFTIDYDKTALSLTKVQDKALFKDASLTTGGDITAVPFRITIDNALATENYTTTGEIAVLKFKVADNAKDGEYDIKLNIDKGSTFNVDMDNVTLTPANGKVTVGDPKPVTTESTTTTTTTTKTTESTTTTTTTATKATESTTTTTTTATKATESTTTTTTTATKAPESTTTTTTTATKAPESTTTTTTTATKATESTTTTTTATKAPESTTTTTTATKATESTTTTTTATKAPETTETTTESTAKAEEVTTTEATTTVEETTTAATTAKQFFKKFSTDDLKEMALNDYKQSTGDDKVTAKASENADGTVAVTIEDADGKTVETYTIFPESGNGRKSNGENVSLPQTGNNSVKNVAAAAVAMAFTLTGAYAMAKSGVLRKKEDEE